MRTPFRRPTRREVFRGAAAVAGTALIPAPAFAQTGSGLVFLNGRITTLDPLRPEATAIGIRDGLVVATGDADDVRALLNGADEIDLGGRRIIPGLNDSHLHATRGARLYALELRWTAYEASSADSI